jgi:hypothetical protein
VHDESCIKKNYPGEMKGRGTASKLQRPLDLLPFLKPFAVNDLVNRIEELLKIEQ